MKQHIRLDYWWYSQPIPAPNANGDAVLIRASSIAPLESWEWGIDREGRPYECHQWLENDFYEDENARSTISWEELLEQIERLIPRLQGIHEDEWAEEYARLRLLLRRNRDAGGD